MTGELFMSEWRLVSSALAHILGRPSCGSKLNNSSPLTGGFHMRPGLCI